MDPKDIISFTLMYKFIFSLIAIFLLSFTSSHAQWEPKPEPPLPVAEQIDKFVAAHYKDQNVMGLSIATLKDGVIKYYNYGQQAADLQEAPTEHHLYEIASMTKTMTATILAQLVKEDKVQLTDPVSKFLPAEVVNWSEDRQITLKELVTHTSGLPRLPKNLFGSAQSKDPANPYAAYDQKALYDFLSKYKPRKLKNREFEYSNLGFGLLGHILSLVDGQSFEEMMHSRILSQLEAGHTSVGPAISVADQTLKVYRANSFETCLWDKAILSGSGSVLASATAMIQYLQLQLEDPSMAVTHTPIHKTTGMAWVNSKMKSGIPYVWHNGGTFGSASFGGFVKDKKVAVIVLSNSGVNVDKVGRRILKLLSH